MAAHGDAVLENLPPLRDVIAAAQLNARKSLGQNFILDLNLTRRIARTAAPLAEHDVIEIGAGPGGLTRALLLESARRVIAIETDARCIPALDAIANASNRLTIINADALTIDPARIATPPFKIVANLPYNIATPLIINWLELDNIPNNVPNNVPNEDTMPLAWESLTLMLQKEVAERLCAEAGSSAYGRLSIITQWRTIPRILFDVPADAFTPRPKVISSLVQITPRPAPLAPANSHILQAITKAAFQQRRKMLRRSLKSLCSKTHELLDRAGIDPTARAETISVEGFCALARAYATMNNETQI